MAGGLTSSITRSFRAGERPLTITSASQLPNLEVWYNASDGKYINANGTGTPTDGTGVNNWYNAGGLTSHVWNTQNSSNFPIWRSPVQNNLGIVRFNVPSGTTQFLTINPVAYIQSLAGATMAIVYRSSSIASGIRYCTSTDVGGFQWGQNGIQLVGGFSGATFSVDSLSADATDFHHIIIKFDGSQTGDLNRLKLRLDGSNVNITITSGAVNAATSSTSKYFFGGCTGTGSGANAQSNFWVGDIGEVLIWTRALRNGEILAVEDYLTNKWAI